MNDPKNPNLKPKTLEEHHPGTTRKQFIDLLKRVIQTKPKKRAEPPASTSSKT